MYIDKYYACKSSYDIKGSLIDKKHFQDIETFQDLEAQHHTQHIVKPRVKENNYIAKYIIYALMYIIQKR